MTLPKWLTQFLKKSNTLKNELSKMECIDYKMPKVYTFIHIHIHSQNRLKGSKEP